MAGVDCAQVGDRATNVSFPGSAVQNSFHALGVSTPAHSVTAGGLMGAMLRPAGWVAFLLLILAGCSGSGGGESAATTDVTSPARTASSTPTREELAGEAAMTAVADLAQVLETALQDPAGRDWEPQIREVAADPYASVAIDGVRTYATGGIRQVGDTTVQDLEVTGVDLAAVGGPTVLLEGCYVSTESDVVRVDNGESILRPDEPERFVWDLIVIQYASTPGAPWLVTVLEPHPDQPC